MMKMAYLGGWLANAFKAGDDRDMELEELEDYIFSFAGDFGMEELVEQAENGKVYPTQEYEEMMDEYIDAYNRETFWDDLVNDLARRDFIEHYGKEAIEKMEITELFEKEQPFIEKYENEFYDNGLQNLRLREKF